jgi:hypothetical protein
VVRVSGARASGRAGIPPIRGRAGELTVIGALIAAVAEGRGGVLVIEGPPGIGKSRLLTEVFALAEKAGVRALFGEAFEYQQTVPFFSLFMATVRADPPVGDAEALRRLGASADLGYWVVRDLQAAIHAAASRIPLAILLEDIHWADNATLLAVLWVLTARTGAGGPAVRETLTALEREDARFVRLTAVTPSAVADIVQDAVRANADASLLSLADKAHGNPFLLTELLRGLDEEGRLDVSGGRGRPRRQVAAPAQRHHATTTRPALPRCQPSRAGSRSAAGPVLGPAARRDAGTPTGRPGVGGRGGSSRRPTHRRRRSDEVSSRSAARSGAAIVAPVAAPSNGAAIGDRHDGHGGGARGGRNPARPQR